MFGMQWCGRIKTRLRGLVCGGSGVVRHVRGIWI